MLLKRLQIKGSPKTGTYNQNYNTTKYTKKANI